MEGQQKTTVNRLPHLLQNVHPLTEVASVFPFQGPLSGDSAAIRDRYPEGYCQSSLPYGNRSNQVKPARAKSSEGGVVNFAASVEHLLWPETLAAELFAPLRSSGPDSGAP
jgi:hypothetical protein